MFRHNLDTVIRYHVSKYQRFLDLSVIRTETNMLLIKYSELSKQLANIECDDLVRELKQVGVSPKVDYCKNYTIKVKW